MQENLNGYTGISIPCEILDDYVVMRFAEIMHEGAINQTIDRAVQHANFGAVILEENSEEIKLGLQKIILKARAKPRSF